MPARPRLPGAVTVIVTVLGDPRIRRTLESLLVQSRPPAVILVDDGGGPEGEVRRIAEEFHEREPRVVWLDAPGTIAQSRNRALAEVATEFVAFLDADEVAPREWLARLLGPFAEPGLGFAGGPTPALAGTARTRGVRYFDAYLRRFYEVEASRNPHALPMGNSAWRTAVFDRVGPLDETLFPGASSEDQEVALRAIRAGWRGQYVASASVDHDFSELTTLGILRKQSRYALGGFLLWRREGSTYEASGRRLAPYVVLPTLVVLGALLTVAPWTRYAGEILLVIGFAGLIALVLGLTAQGLGWDRRYPGMRYRAFELLRRWANLWGAARGLWRYGWSGRRGASTPRPVSAKR